MSQALVQNSLKVRIFRAFHHLRIEQMGRVIRIAGKRGVSKTCPLVTCIP